MYRRHNTDPYALRGYLDDTTQTRKRLGDILTTHNIPVHKQPSLYSPLKPKSLGMTN